MKHRQRASWSLLLGLLLALGLICWLINRQIVATQKVALSRIATSYQRLVPDEITQKQFARANQVIVFDDYQNPTTPVTKSATDITDRGQNNQQFFTRRRFNGQSYLLFVAPISGKPVTFITPQSNMWQVAPTLTTLFLSIYLLLALIGTWLVDRWWRRFLAKLKVLVQNIHRSRHEIQPAPIIFNRHDVLYPLAEETNKLNDDLAHLRGKVLLRQASFDRLIDNLPVGVMLINEDRQIILHNEAMGNLLGHKISDEIHPYVDDVKTYALSRMIEKTFRHHKNHQREIQLVQAPQAFVEANVIELSAVQQRPQVLVILYDLTSVRAIEQMQLDFVSNVSHELKTPVTAIQGFAETLLDGAKDVPETNTKFLKIILQESQRLGQLIQDILALSRLDQKQESVATKIFPAALVQQELSLLQNLIDEKQLTVQVEIDPQLSLQTDSNKLTQVVNNLLANAIFYNREQGQIKVTAQETATQFILQVADTGLGIAENQQQRVFERFYRIDPSRNQNSGGTGLGLAIVQEICQSLGGKITLQSQLSVGSTFTVELPLNATPV